MDKSVATNKLTMILDANYILAVLKNWKPCF